MNRVLKVQYEEGQKVLVFMVEFDEIGNLDDALEKAVRAIYGIWKRYP